MELREKLIKKVDYEYQMFLNKIGKYSTEDIVEHSKEITIYRAIYKYLHSNVRLSNKEIKYLMRFNNPIKLIADYFYLSKIELIRMSDEACTFVTQNKMNYKSVL